MTDAMRATNVIPASSQQQRDNSNDRDANTFIPEIIEETRNDHEGKPVIHRYTRGKLLGRVSCYYRHYILAIRVDIWARLKLFLFYFI